MQLTDVEIKEYQRLHRETFGESISREEAIRSGGKLVRLLQVIIDPMPITPESKKPP